MAAQASTLHLQIETTQAAPSQDAEPRRLRLTWFFQGMGLAALLLVGVAACGPPDWITYGSHSGSGKVSRHDAMAGSVPAVPGVKTPAQTPRSGSGGLPGPPDWITYEPRSGSGGLSRHDVKAAFFPAVPGVKTPTQTPRSGSGGLPGPPDWITYEPLSGPEASALTTGDLEALSTGQQGSTVARAACRGMLNFVSSSSCTARATVAMQDGGNGWSGQTTDGQSYEVEFTIMQDGRMTYKIQGIKGDGCVSVSDNIKQILEQQFGCEVYETKATEEMFEQPVTVEVSEGVDVQV